MSSWSALSKHTKFDIALHRLRHCLFEALFNTVLSFRHAFDRLRRRTQQDDAVNRW